MTDFSHDAYPWNHRVTFVQIRSGSAIDNG
jgi:hypothetical protein